MLNRADEAVPHYASSLEQLQNYAEAMNVSDRNQELFGEGFEDDEDSRTGEEGAMSTKACQGRIQYASNQGTYTTCDSEMNFVHLIVTKLEVAMHDVHQSYWSCAGAVKKANWCFIGTGVLWTQ